MYGWKEKKHITIPQKLRIIRRHWSGTNWREFTASKHWIVNNLWHKETEWLILIVYGIMRKC